jgi:hypothetical protein
MPVVVELDDRALRGVALAVKAAGREQRRAIGAATQKVARPVWRREVLERMSTTQDSAVYGKPMPQVSRGNPPELVAGQGSRARSGGLVPATMWHMVELGGLSMTDRIGRRRVVPGQLPRRNPRGRIALPASRTVRRALASAWAEVTMGIYGDALESDGG